MRIKNYDLVLSDSDMQDAISSDPIYLGHIAHFSIQLVYTGTPNGAFKIQVSNDLGAVEDKIDLAQITNWTDLPNSSTAITAAGSMLFNESDIPYRWARLVWTDSSSGDPSTVTVARVNLKGI